MKYSFEWGDIKHCNDCPFFYRDNEYEYVGCELHKKSIENYEYLGNNECEIPSYCELKRV